MRKASMLIAAAFLAASGGVTVAAEKAPPVCAAITFRPVPAGLSDGEQNAGLYKSNFGRIDVVAKVEKGAPIDYFVEFNGKPPKALKGPVPPNVASCAKAKLRGTVGTPPERCLGDRLAVLIDHYADRRYILLYAQRGKEWYFCSVGSA
ncbi:MAG TPA: hypothetical protein VLX85_05925 [Stellaceae bacterium]|nr:hypothetical protein [Stellaceae bacterium]